MVGMDVALGTVMAITALVSLLGGPTRRLAASDLGVPTATDNEPAAHLGVWGLGCLQPIEPSFSKLKRLAWLFVAWFLGGCGAPFPGCRQSTRRCSWLGAIAAFILRCRWGLLLPLLPIFLQLSSFASAGLRSHHNTVAASTTTSATAMTMTLTVTMITPKFFTVNVLFSILNGAAASM
mmetsp:Transcript_1550/g.3395  ORF Transcript_1550/g.3395 Transcript_1550/m.3395 type:complete len:179 (-) Transcript_1550:301-837(-)